LEKIMFSDNPDEIYEQIMLSKNSKEEKPISIIKT
jgi:phage-related protein